MYILGLCCSSYNRRPKFCPAPNFRTSLESVTSWLHTLNFTPWAHVSLQIDLPCSFHPIFCMRPCSRHAQGLRFMCTWCVHYENICWTHTGSHIHYSERIIIVNVMNPAQEKIEKIDQRLRIQPLRGGNLLYIT